MRAYLAIGFGAALAACNPYSPNLGPHPFKCGDMGECPSGYSCNTALTPNVCEEDNGGPDAPPGVADAGCADMAEPNDMLNMATLGPVFGANPTTCTTLQPPPAECKVQYEGLTLCPSTDKDWFHINQPLNCGGIGPSCPNVDVTVNFELLTAPPTLVIANATGVTVAPGGSTGVSGELKAVLNNASQGQYYAVVSAGGGMTLPHYKLTIDGTRP